MANLNIENNVDFKQNQVINIVLDPRTTAPANGKVGQFYYNTTEDKLYRFNGSIWKAFDDIVNITSNNSSLQVDIENGIADLGVNVDNASIEIATSGEVRIKDSGVTTPKLADSVVTTIKITDKNVTFAKIQDIPTMTIIGRVEAGTGSASAISVINEDDMASASATNLATAGSIKAYVDARLAGLGKLIGGFDASIATQLPGSVTTMKGDYWYVTQDGNVAGVSFNRGDVIIANKDGAGTSPNDYIFLETNRDKATETILGLVKLASPSEIQAVAPLTEDKAVTVNTLIQRKATENVHGLIEIANDAKALDFENDTHALTPKKVKLILDSIVGGYSAVFGDGATTTFQLSHPLNTKQVIADFFYTENDKNFLVSYAPISTGMIEVYFNNPPALNSVRVVAKK